MLNKTKQRLDGRVKVFYSRLKTNLQLINVPDMPEGSSLIQNNFVSGLKPHWKSNQTFKAAVP